MEIYLRKDGSGYNMAKKILKIFFGIVVILIGLNLIYVKTGNYYIYTIGEYEKEKLINIYINKLSSIKIPKTSKVLSAGLVRRNYTYGYRIVYYDENNFNEILKFYEQELSDKKYKISRLENKIIAQKDNYAVVIYRDLNNQKRDKNKWYLYIKPNDIFEWGYLDFGEYQYRNIINFLN